MKFSNKIEAIAFIEFSSIPTDEKITLTRLIEEHALNREIKVIGSDGEIASILFEADHDVESHIELDTAIIDVHSLAGVSSVTNQTKEIQMTIENNTQATAAALNEMETIIAASMKKILESSLDPILETALNKQQERIEATVKKTVDESLKATVDEAVKKALDEAAKNAAKDAEAKKAEGVKAAEAGLKQGAKEQKETKEAVEGFVGSLSKAAMYVAGAAAVATGGYFAWQKWGGTSSAPAAE